jgi:hypothetical protein
MSPGFFFEFLQLLFSELEVLFPNVDQELDTSQVIFPAPQRNWRLLGTWSNDVIGDASNVHELNLEDIVRVRIGRRQNPIIGSIAGGRKGVCVESKRY